MQAMTLLRRILDGEMVFNIMDTKSPGLSLVDTNLGEMVRGAVCFDIQVAADIHATMNAYTDPDMESYGPLRLPYPAVWMEWVVAEGTFEDDLVGMKCGALLYEVTSDEQAGLVLRWFCDGSNGLYMSPVDLGLRTDLSGRVIEYGVVLRPGAKVSKSQYNDAGTTSEMFARPALMALGLINCKNVVHRETGSLKMARSGTEKRRGVPAKELRYNTIILPGGGTVSGTRGGSSHRASAIHRVRGHFKTFTAEKPLLGRHVGTWWWGWSLRGDPQNGEVHSDYVLGERP